MMDRSTGIVVCMCWLLLIGGCATSHEKHARGPQIPPSLATQDLAAAQDQAALDENAQRSQTEQETIDEASKRELRRTLSKIPARMKTGLISPPPFAAQHPAEVFDSKKQKILFNFDKADITEVTNEIFGAYLKVGYVIDPSLQGRISLYLEGEYTKQELIQLITRAYSASNVSIVPRDGVYYIQPIQRTASSSLPVANSFMLKADKKGVRPVIVIYRPKYLDAAQAINTIKFFLTPGRPMISDPMTNTILFAEDTDNAKTILEILRSLDMNVLKEIGMEVVQLQALSPEEAVKSVEAVMGKLAVFQNSSLKNNIAFLPLEQLGGVLILAQNNEVLQIAKHWLTALDVQGRQAGDQIQVYFVENGLASDIGDILNQVFDIKEKSKTKLKQEVVGPGAAMAAPGKEVEKKETVSPGGGVSATLSGKATIIADETNNAIVVRANASDQIKIGNTIKALDIMPRAVLIEVLIAEVTLTDELSYGVEWFIKNKGMDLFGYDGQYNMSLSDGTTYDSDISLGSTSTGLTFFWGSLGGDINLLVSLLSSETQVHILSTPTLLATDNQEATINVGGSEPIITQQSQNVSSESTIVNTVQYVDTGIILTVTPHINSGGFIRNEIDLTIRDAQKNTISGIDSPSFTERKVTTTLLAENGQTVLIGGIIQHRTDEGSKGIPFLRNVPVLNPVFGSKNRSGEKRELIIAITQHVRRRKEDAVSREFLSKLSSIKQKIQKHSGISDEELSLLGTNPKAPPPPPAPAQ